MDCHHALCNKLLIKKKKSVLIDKILVHKDSGHSRVNKSLHKKSLRDVNNLQNDKKIEKYLMDIKSANSRILSKLFFHLE